MFGAISAKFRTFVIASVFAIPSIFTFPLWLGEFSFPIAKIQNSNELSIKLLEKFSTFHDSPYLVVFECMHQMDIHDLEQRLHQDKLPFASETRMEKYLGLKPGSVSPFGLINDTENHVHLFMDKNLEKAPRLSFHPNDNTATIVIKNEDFIKFLDATGNGYEFVELYE